MSGSNEEFIQAHLQRVTKENRMMHSMDRLVSVLYRLGVGCASKVRMTQVRSLLIKSVK